MHTYTSKDRLDYSEFFNYDADDNISWIPRNGTTTTAGRTDLGIWGPARALRLSYRHTFNRLHEKLHPKAIRRAEAQKKEMRYSNDEVVDGTAGADADADEPKDKMILNNCNLLCRLDEMHAFDGTFSEGASLNSVAWTGLRNPTILWTYGLSDDVAALDAFFQQHLLMDAYPMAPMPKNDHSITPGSMVVEQAYVDYAPLFNAMHGARWLLTAHPAAVKGSVSASANVLTAGIGAGNGVAYVVPVMLGNSSSAATAEEQRVVLSLNLPGSATKSVRLTALHPGGAGAVVSVGPATKTAAGAWEATVPLVRGCALVQVTVA